MAKSNAPGQVRGMEDRGWQTSPRNASRRAARRLDGAGSRRWRSARSATTRKRFDSLKSTTEATNPQSTARSASRAMPDAPEADGEPEEHMVYLTADDVLRLHAAALSLTIAQARHHLRQGGFEGLEAAVARPRQVAAYMGDEAD